MEQLSFKVEAFEGPLDLLLKLIAKNKVNIFDIPVAVILDQYMEAIEDMKRVDMEVASEFVSMASYLLYIKSRMLLPQHEEEEEDPRETLVKMLLEYQRYKAVAKDLTEMYSGVPLTATRKPLEMEFEEEAYSKRHSCDELAVAYQHILRKIKHRLPPPVHAFKGIVGTTWTTISSRVVNLLRRLIKKRKMPLNEAFETARSRSDIVATFLAVLELMSNKKIKVEGENNTMTILSGKVADNDNTGN